MRFDATTTTNQVLEGIDLNGKTAVITGASGGLGAEAARALASKGARVILASRALDKTQQQVELIKESTGNHQLEAVALDLADFASIRQATAQIQQLTDRIDILINNAGVMACPLERSQQGLEMQFGVNHIGHFLFTNLLMPTLKATNNARIVILSSGGHKHANIDLNDPNWQQREYNKWEAYGAAKTANALFAVALNQRLQDRGITANAVHPGVIFTDLGRHLTAEDIAFLTGGDKETQKGTESGEKPRGELVMKSVEAGAATSVWAATHPSLQGRGGLFLEDCGIAELVQEGIQSHGYYHYALDEQAAETLWQCSEEIVGQTFNSL